MSDMVPESTVILPLVILTAVLLLGTALALFIERFGGGPNLVINNIYDPAMFDDDDGQDEADPDAPDPNSLYQKLQTALEYTDN